jgi:hydroxymethylglutaryl-CoA reductase
VKAFRLSGLYRLNVSERIARLHEHGWLSPGDAERLRDGQHVLSLNAADNMIENVVGVFGLPLGIAPNFIVNGREHVVPLVVEEPSIVAGLSSAARLARPTGGFKAQGDRSLLIGQIHVTGMDDPDNALEAVRAAQDDLVDAANRVHPRLVARGGGVHDLELRLFQLPDGSPLLAVHLLVDTCDAMGANLVNTICEALAPDIAGICGGRVALRILSNLADRSLYTAHVRYAVDSLGGRDLDGQAVRDAIVTAGEIAVVDPYRATTHNKGIMNGIDALAIATGNDWRAIEAGAHAWAAATGRYASLSRWSVAENGDLEGEITLPLKIGTVGGTLANNPAASLGLALTGAATAHELAMLMASVGLAQNFAALRALATDGIQAGHMKLHARSVAAAVDAPESLRDQLVTRLIDSGDIKEWKARELLAGLQRSTTDAPTAGTAAGKIILLGEHGVVYGRHALAVPIPEAVRVVVEEADALMHELPDDFVALLLRELGITDTGYRISLESRLPFGMGLGSSAAVAVAIARAFDRFLSLGLDDERVNEIAFASEQLAHGTPSGIDNTLATYARPMLFQRDDDTRIDLLDDAVEAPLLVAWGATAGRTSEQVAAVRERRAQMTAHFDALFDEMGRLSRQGAELLRAGDFAALGGLMNICHGLLNAIGVSTPELERMVALARQSGAAGAKLTGAGGGGSIVALCPDGVGEVRAALRRAGFNTLVPHEKMSP